MCELKNKYKDLVANIIDKISIALFIIISIALMGVGLEILEALVVFIESSMSICQPLAINQ